MNIFFSKKRPQKNYLLPQDKRKKFFNFYYPLATQFLIDNSLNKGPATFLFSSSERKEGKTHISINIGFHLALRNRRVLVVDLNPWNPTLTRCFRLEREKGFLNLLEDNLPLKGIQPFADIVRFHVLGIGQSDQDIIGLIQQNLHDSFFKGNYDFIILDAPSVNQHCEILLLTGFVSKVFMVVRFGKTKYSDIEKAKNRFEVNSGKVDGVIVNHYRNPIPRILR